MSLRESNHFRFSHLALVLLITVLASGCSRGADKNPEDTFSIRSASGVELITINDIQEYHWPTHTLTLAPGVLERLQKQLAGELVSGYLRIPVNPATHSGFILPPEPLHSTSVFI